MWKNYFVIGIIAVCVYHWSSISLILEHAKYTLCDMDMPFEDRAIAFYLSIPGIFPFAQIWIKDNDVGRTQIAVDRKTFNSFVNAEHSKQLSEKGLEVETIQVPVRDGSFINLHLYKSIHSSKATGRRPLYVWMHGGGFVYGEGRDSLLVEGMPECNESVEIGNEVVTFNNVIVASIEYRLPPESKFPVATDDCMDTLLWLMSHSSDIGFDPSFVSIGGTSAGGNLAAVLAQRAFRAGIQIRHQLILVPVMYYGCVTRSCMENSNLPLLGAKEIVWFHNMYGNSYADGYHPHYNPLMFGNDCPTSSPVGTQNVSAVTLAPATLITAKKDALRDDGIDYVDYLKNVCSINVKHVELPGSHWSVYSHTDVYKMELRNGVCVV